MNNTYTLNLQIADTLKALKEIAKKLSGLRTMQTAFTVATFAIYFSFTSVIFAGVTVWGLQDYLFEKSSNVIALVWVIVVVFGVPLALSLGKHFNYQAIADSAIERNKNAMLIHSMIALALLSGVYYEAISSSANLQSKVFHAVDYKSALQTILSSSTAVSTDSGLNADIASAATKLAQCEERLKQGKEKHCEGAKAKLDALKQSQSAGLKASAESSANATQTKANVLKGAVDDQSLPAAKWIAQTFGLSNDGGTMMIVIIAALFFELIHLTTVFSEVRTLLKRDSLQNLLTSLQGAYYKSTGKVYNPDDFTDNRVIDLSNDELPDTTPERFEADGYEIRTNGTPYQDNKTGFGFVPQTATKFKWQREEKPLPAPQEKVFGFMKSGQQAGNTNLSQVHVDTPETRLYTVAGTPTERNPLKSIDTRLNVQARETNVQARETNVQARETPIYQTFEDLPKYPVGCCEWCGGDVSLKRKGTRFCSDDHKNKWWNLKKPSNKRTERSF